MMLIDQAGKKEEWSKLTKTVVVSEGSIKAGMNDQNETKSEWNEWIMNFMNELANKLWMNDWITTCCWMKDRLISWKERNAECIIHWLANQSMRNQSN